MAERELCEGCVGDAVWCVRVSGVEFLPVSYVRS